MRKVLILVALLPGLAFADSVGGPATNTIQTQSPQNNAASLNLLQPAPNASDQSLSAPSANTLQGSAPSSDQKLQVESEGAPQSLPDKSASSNLITILMAVFAVILAGAAVTVWQLTMRDQPAQAEEAAAGDVDPVENAEPDSIDAEGSESHDGE